MADVEVLHHRYANALFEVAISKRKEDDIMANLQFLTNFIRNNKIIAKFLYNPEIEDEKKLQLLFDMGRIISPCAYNF